MEWLTKLQDTNVDLIVFNILDGNLMTITALLGLAALIAKVTKTPLDNALVAWAKKVIGGFRSGKLTEKDIEGKNQPPGDS